MNWFSKRKKVVLLTITFTVLVLTIFVGRFIAVRPVTKLHQHVPSEAKAVLKINNANILHRYAFDYLYNNKQFTNQPNLNLLLKKSSLPLLGIAAKSELIIFYEDWNDYPLLGFLFTIGNEEALNNYLNEFPFLVAAYNNEMACVLMIPEDLKASETELFQNYAQDLLLPNLDKTKVRLALSKTKANTLFHLYFEGASKSLLQEIDVQVTFLNEKIILDGSSIRNPFYSSDTLEQHYIASPYKENNLTIQATNLPDTLAYYTQKLFNSLNLPSSNIRSQQLILYGIDLVNVDKKLVVLPLIDAVVRYTDETSNGTNTVQTKLDVNSSSAKDTITIGNNEFYKIQLSENEYYIGINPTPSIQKRPSSNLFMLSGNPSVLFTIEGKGIISQLVQIIPLVQASKSFLDEFENFTIETSYIEGREQIKIDGELNFLEKHIASLKLLNYLLELNTP